MSTSKTTNAAEVQRELRFLLEARYTLLWVRTDEERRAERAIASVGLQAGYRVRFWDCAAGVTDLYGKPVALDMIDSEGKPVSSDIPVQLPAAAFEAIRARKPDAKGNARELWVLRDLHQHLQEPVTVRALRNLARDLQDEVSALRQAAVVVVSPSGEVPTELRSTATVLDWPLPDREEIKTILKGALEASGSDAKNGKAQAIVEAAAGLTAEDVAGSFARSLVEHKRIDPGVIANHKKRIIERERTLAWWPPDERGLDAIGGLELLKAWVTEKRSTLAPGAKEFGLRAPRGVLLAGVPGCGKSAMAKAIPAALGDFPLLRLDMNGLKGSLMGQSEENIRRALRLADAMGRCVLWIDEVGKVLAGATNAQGGDSGVAADALSELLFWMQEHEGEAMVIGTTNEMDLPPEFIRRFDAMFFVDLPTAVEREAILAVSLRAVNRDPAAFDLKAVAKAARGFSGDEVTKLVQSGLLRAWNDGKRELATGDLIGAAEAWTPMSTTSGEKIRAMRAWAKGRAMPASIEEEAAPTPQPDQGIPVTMSSRFALS